MTTRLKVLFVPIGSVETDLLEKIKRGLFRNFRRPSIVNRKVDAPTTMHHIDSIAEDLDKILDNQDASFIIPVDLIILIGHQIPGYDSMASVLNNSLGRTVLVCPMKGARPTHLLVREILHGLGHSFELPFCRRRTCFMNRKTLGVSSKSSTEPSLCYSCSLVASSVQQGC